ncbi:MAG: hypothetical protein NT031_18940, partial [Planctomycetota bacterium]|nr:hypothetical protein [Planctomycetota bacterium]
MKTSAAGNDPAKKLPPTPRPGWSWLGRHWALAMLAMAVLAGAGAWGAWRYIHRSPAAIEGVRHVVLISIDTCRADRL